VKKQIDNDLVGRHFHMFCLLLTRKVVGRLNIRRLVDYVETL